VIKLSPAVKILLYISLIILVFLSNSIKTDAAILLIVLIPAFRIPVSTLKRGSIPITIFLMFTMLSNLFYQSGRILIEIRGFAITYEGIQRGTHLTLRLFLLILGAKILTSSTSADDLVRGIINILGPVGRSRPVREFIFTLSLTLRFLPEIYDEAKTLYRESSRNYEDITWIERLKTTVSVISPLFERSLKRARELSKNSRV
jgi:energy-coupling factor transporter transmembrane protein EcfT